MPLRNKIALLPAEKRAAVDAELIKRGFSNYKEFVTFCKEELDVTVSESGAQRYGQDFQTRVDAIRISREQAIAINDVVGDESGALNDALIALVQDKLMLILSKEKLDKKDLVALSTAIAQLGKASTGQKKLMFDIRKRVEEAGAKIKEQVKLHEVDADAAKQIHKIVLGIAK